MATCFDCGDKYPDKRKFLGYNVCIKCGDKIASDEVVRKSKCIAPLFNKGAYQYIGNIKEAKHIGR
jgi:hypothetical protein